MSHGDAITTAPPGFTVTASTPGAPVAALEDRERAVYGVQFHPEVVHTERGQEVLKRVPVRRVRLPAHVDQHVDHRARRSTRCAPRSATSG